MIDLLQEGTSHKSCEDISLALKSVVQIIKQLNWAVYNESPIFDKLNDAANE